MERSRVHERAVGISSGGRRASGRRALIFAAALVALAVGEPTAFGQKGEPIKRPEPKASPSVRERVIKPTTGSLAVVTGVVGSEVTIERVGSRTPLRKEATSDATGSVAFDGLPPGPYRIVARHADHHECEKEAKVVVGTSVTVVAHLVPTFATLVLDGADLPEDLAIEIDGRGVAGEEIARDGDGRIRIRVAPGDHTLRVSAATRRAFSTEVEVEAGKEAPVAVLLPAIPGRLLVAAPAGAIVYVDRAEVGRVPSTKVLVVEVAPGVEHRLRVELDGHEPVARTETVAAGDERAIEVRPVPIPTSGRFEDGFFGGTGLWDAPAAPAWQTDSSRGVLCVTSGMGLAKGIWYGDFQMVFGLRLVDGIGAGWLVRARPNGDGYLFVLSGSASSAPNLIRAYVVREGEYDEDAPASTLPVIPALEVGSDYVVKVRVEGDTIRTWITPAATGREVSVGLYRDLNGTFRAGGLGFAGVGGRFEVDLVSAEPLPPSRAAER